MKSDQRITRKGSGLRLIGILLPPVFLFLISLVGFTQEMKGEEKEIQDKFSYPIENGAKMIRGNEYEKVLNMIGELSAEKKSDFMVRVIENFAYLKSYLAIEKDGT